MSRPISGGDIIVQVLADEGVDTVFGYSGGAILPTYDAVFRYNELARESGRREIQLVVPASEQGAGFMAAGYARSSGRVGVFMVTSGPGARSGSCGGVAPTTRDVPSVRLTTSVPSGSLTRREPSGLTVTTVPSPRVVMCGLGFAGGNSLVFKPARPWLA